MAIGDTDIVICNKALTFLAADPITSFSDALLSADACNRIYKIVKESTIEVPGFLLGEANTSQRDYDAD